VRTPGRRFLPGRELARRFYWEAVRPILDEQFPGIEHSAGLLGPGSEVLGLDTERSMDHDWGPRLQVFVESAGNRIEETLATRLPHRFAGYPTSFTTLREGEGTTRLLEERSAGRVDHRVEVHRPAAYFLGLLGFDPAAGVQLEDWLLTPSQLLLSVSKALVFHDGLGVLGQAQRLLQWYPHDLWLYMLACQWRRIAQEEAFVGRTGDVGDEIGSRLVAGRLARDLVRLCFLQERRHAPYLKWLGTAFSRLDAAVEAGPLLEEALSASGWRPREAALGRCCELLAGRHNALGITPPLDPGLRSFHGRPFQVLFADRFAAACREAITEPAVRRLGWLGSVDQFGDSTDLLSQPTVRRTLAGRLAPPGP
jgi:Domain of unknown function (DUF4037)